MNIDRSLKPTNRREYLVGQTPAWSKRKFKTLREAAAYFKELGDYKTRIYKLTHISMNGLIGHYKELK